MTPAARRCDRRTYPLLCLWLLVLPLAAMCAHPVPAKADPVSDTVYLRTLTQLGVDYSTTAAAVAMGHGVCESFDAGASFNKVITELQSAGWTAANAATIVGVAVGAYCPQHESAFNPNAATAVVTL